jgi:hypothetical protein
MPLEAPVMTASDFVKAAPLDYVDTRSVFKPHCRGSRWAAPIMNMIADPAGKRCGDWVISFAAARFENALGARIRHIRGR